MKTKILFFCAVIPAVALIGLARPSSPKAVEAKAVLNSFGAAGPGIVEGSPCPAGPAVQAIEQGQQQSQTEETKAQEKKKQEQAQAQPQEETKPKVEKKPTVVVTVQKGEKHRHVITIKEGDKVKTITLDKPVIIKEGAEGKVILITPAGKEVTVLEGEPAHLEIKADELEIIEEGKIAKVGKDGATVYVIVKPDIDIGKAVDLALEEVPTTFMVAEPVTAHVTLEPNVKVDTYVAPHLTLVSEDLEKEIREKLRDIREKLKEVEEKKLELREIDKALADLEADLEKMSRETSRVAVVHTEKPEVLTIVEKESHLEAGQHVEPEVGVEIEEAVSEHPVKVVVKEKGTFSLYYEVAAGGKGREAYERIVARVKKELPEGFTLEPKFEEESGLITLKVNGPFGKGAPHDLVQKLADSIREETKEKEE